MYTPPGTLRSRSFTRFTMRVGLLHFGQSVDFVVSIAFLRSPVLAILAMRGCFSFRKCLCTHAQTCCTRLQRRGRYQPLLEIVGGRQPDSLPPSLSGITQISQGLKPLHFEGKFWHN